MSDTCEIECELKDETDAAYIIVIDERTHSVPKFYRDGRTFSEFTSSSKDGVVGELSLPEWFATKEGLV